MDFDDMLLGELLDGPLIDFWTPGRIVAYVEKADARMSTFNGQVVASKAAASFKQAWGAFYESWVKLADAHDTWLSGLAGPGVISDVERFERELAIWQRQFRKLGGTTVVDLEPARDDPNAITIAPVWWVAAGVAAAGVAYYYLRRRY